MKLSTLLMVSAFLMGASLPAWATPTVDVTDSFAGTLGTMPGSGTDYTFFGNESEFPSLLYFAGTHSGQPTVLTDFTVAAGANAQGQYSGGDNYSTIYDPLGNAVGTGDLFGPGSAGGDKPDMVDFTLGKTGSTFNFSDFDVYVMFGNGPGDGNDRITNVDLSVFSASSVLLGSDAPVLVTDTNASTSLASFEEFHITGASAGDVIQIGTGTISPFSSYLGGVSFEVPEPSTWALMLAGVAFLGFRIRSKATRFHV
jgi:hypothetical protein